MKKTAFILSLVCLFASACADAVPDRSSGEYPEAVTAFYVGLAALQVGDDQRAARELRRATELAADEPAAWNNLGVLQLRQKNFEEAAASLEKARGLAPETALIHANIAALEIDRGNFEKAVESLNRTIELEPRNVRAIYLLAAEKERARDDAAALELYRKILETRPDNVAVRLEVARLAAKLGRKELLREMIEAIGKDQENWPDEARKQFDLLREAAAGGDANRAATQVAFFRNALLRDAGFRAGVAEIKPSDTAAGEPIVRPLRLEAPEFSPAEPDLALAFRAEPAGDAKAGFAAFVFPDAERPVTAWSDGEKTHVGGKTLPFGISAAAGLAVLDHDYDYRNDIALAGENGFRLFRQTDAGEFADVTGRMKLTEDALAYSYNGVWPLDIDNEGDLDLLLGRKDKPPLVLQNNGDGTFTETSPMRSARDVTDLVYADLDEDGDADAVVLEGGGTLKYFSNMRGGLFEERELPALPRSQAIGVGDADGDGKLDLLVAGGGTVLRVTDRSNGGGFDSKELFKTDVCGAGTDECVIDAADLDNNGGTDILVSGGGRTGIHLSGPDGNFRAAHANVAARVSGIADADGDGRLDLAGIDANERPAVFRNGSAKGYHWQIVRPKAAKTEGDQRINTYGIGGEMELRAGLLNQKRLIRSPQVHFGLGEMKRTDVVRIVWQNGSVQAEFDLESDQAVAAPQRLKGSCPHLFAWNGEKFEHVKDAPPWSPALGLRINAQDTYGILQTEEWFKIPGDKLKPKEGFYELRITGDYWESFYLDSYDLLVVDHPAETEVFTDERFSIPLPPLKVFTTGETKTFARAVDHNGRDVLETVSRLDEEYLDGIERGKYQGIAEDHYVELELPAGAPREGPLWLVGDGFIHPSDASINVQRGQGAAGPPRSLSIEVPDADGNWRTAKDNLGFPAGKMKTVLLDLTGIFPETTEGPRRLRLRTELEVFWDKLAWAVGLPDEKTRIRRLDPAAAELRYRGFSVIEKRDDSSPEVPVYDRIQTTGQRWRDLEGYYTRFGDVRELLAAPDDRYVLTNAGDELVLRFPVLPDQPEGWRRDYVIVGNGWIKDGDLNSVFSKTLLPLPTRATNDYTRRPTTLEEDPVYRRNRADWEKFHTRYVSPDAFRNALRGDR